MVLNQENGLFDLNERHCFAKVKAMLNPQTFHLPPALAASCDAILDDFAKAETIGRIWQRDPSVWTSSGEDRWLGWLDIAGRELSDLTRYHDIDELAKGFDHIVVLGMGGSSLCPEVIASTFGKKNFHILDSTVPAQILRLERSINLAKTLFIVASKSGSTLEPNTFKEYFFSRVSEVVPAGDAGSRFIAITDPGSLTEKVAERDRFAGTFLGDPEIGGRFSALSVFGLAAVAAMGIDVEAFLQNAELMTSACRREAPVENPGAMLGAVMAAAHRAGRDKLTVVASPELSGFGAWLEQLVAESIGKNGVSIIPIESEPVADVYGEDRLFVHIKMIGSRDTSRDSFVEALESQGHPVATILVSDTLSIGQEFFRWEFATAVAGAAMGINPFDQPDVEAAKIATRKLTEEFEQSGELPSESPILSSDGISIFSGETSSHATSLEASLLEHIDQVNQNDYFAILAYLEMSPENQILLQKMRQSVLKRTGAATTAGFGPRFLHSTGQAHKGGANNGVFLMLTADDTEDIAVPGRRYSFATVKDAQARGDFEVLAQRGRRVIHLHLSGDLTRQLERITDILKK